MARIPRAQELGLGDQAAQVTRGVVSVPTIDQSGTRTAAAALDQVGTHLREFSQRIQKAETDKKIVEASRKTREDLDRAYRDITESSDILPEDYEKHYREESDRIISANAEMVPSGGRDMWRERALGWQSDAVIRTRDTTRQRQVDRVQGGIVAEIEAIDAQAGDLSLSEKTVADNIAGTRGLIDRQVREGTIGEEAGARFQAQLDGMSIKSAAVRWNAQVEALAEQGQFDAAEELAKGGTDAGIPKPYIDDAKAAITRAQNRFEKEKNERWQINDANFQVDILKGKNSYRHIDEAIARGDLNPARRDTLWRAVREEDDRRKAEAERSALSKAQQAALKEQSANIAAMFRGLAKTPGTASYFLQDRSQWSEGHRAMFEAMEGDDQRAIIQLQTEGRTYGASSDAASKVFTDLMTEAQRWAPKDWKLGSTTRDALTNNDNMAITKALMAAAEDLAPKLGQNLIPQKEAQAIVGRIFSQHNPNASWLHIPEVVQEAEWVKGAARLNAAGQAWSSGSGVDWTLWNEIKAQLGPSATTSDIEAEYLSAGGKLP